MMDARSDNEELAPNDEGYLSSSNVTASNLNQLHNEIMNKISNIEQHLFYCVNDYDFHHKNNEHKIMAENLEILKKAQHILTDYNSKVAKMREEIFLASDTCTKSEELISELFCGDKNATFNCTAESDK